MNPHLTVTLCDLEPGLPSSWGGSDDTCCCTCLLSPESPQPQAQGLILSVFIILSVFMSVCSLRPGTSLNSPCREVGFICPIVLIDPIDLGATTVVAPRLMLDNFLPIPDAESLPFYPLVLKLVVGIPAIPKFKTTFTRYQIIISFLKSWICRNNSNNSYPIFCAHLSRLLEITYRTSS